MITKSHCARGEVQRERAAERAVQRGHGAAVYPQEAIIRGSVMDGAVASAEGEDSSRIAVSLNSDWGGWIRG